MKKIVVATDIHGSALRGRLIVDAFLKEGADKLILLGDVYYHGPRNPLPDGHAPMELAEVLNAVSDKIICVRGNCDADIDLMISDFEFHAPTVIRVGEKTLFLTHGHENVLAPEGTDVTLRGHFHVNSDDVVCGQRVLGISSASLPKCGCEPCYVLVSGDMVEYKRLLDGATEKIVKI